MSDPILITTDLGKQYGDNTAVADLSFAILRGEIFSLLGPNGAGKTTTIGMLSTLLPPTSGHATIDGHDILRDPMAVRRSIGLVPQEIALYDELSARQNMQFWGRMAGLGGAELQRRCNDVLDQVGLLERADERIDTYSGGMKRRANIAAGLLHRPALLFMDEPTVGIDPQSRRRILDMVKELRAQGITVLYTTHYMEEAAELSDRVGIMDHGRLIALGTQQELTELVGRQETLRLHFGEGHSANGDAALFDGLPGVVRAGAADGQIVLSVADASAALPGVYQRATAAGLAIRSIDIEEPNLEAVFLHLTGRALRD